MLVYIMLES